MSRHPISKAVRRGRGTLSLREMELDNPSPGFPAGAGLRRRAEIRVVATAMAALPAIATSACGPLPRLNPVPQTKDDDITVLGLSNVRYWGDENTPQMEAEGRLAYRRQQDHWRATGHTGPLPPAHFLAVSGGGENGAFGAGLLVG